ASRADPASGSHGREHRGRRLFTQGVPAGGRDVADVQLKRLETGELAAHNARDDVQTVAFVDGFAQVRASERDPVENVHAPAKGQLRVAAGRRADARDGQSEDRD